MVVADSMRPVLAGAIAGIGVMFAGARVLASQVYGIQPEAGPLALTIAVLVVVAIAASAIPARRAGRVDPADELRR
jgi:putative ABC transport system permease protein